MNERKPLISKGGFGRSLRDDGTQSTQSKKVGIERRISNALAVTPRPLDILKSFLNEPERDSLKRLLDKGVSGEMLARQLIAIPNLSGQKVPGQFGTSSRELKRLANRMLGALLFFDVLLLVVGLRQFQSKAVS